MDQEIRWFITFIHSSINFMNSIGTPEYEANLSNAGISIMIWLYTHSQVKPFVSSIISCMTRAYKPPTEILIAWTKLFFLVCLESLERSREGSWATISEPINLWIPKSSEWRTYLGRMSPARLVLFNTGPKKTVKCSLDLKEEWDIGKSSSDPEFIKKGEIFVMCSPEEEYCFSVDTKDELGNWTRNLQNRIDCNKYTRQIGFSKVTQKDKVGRRISFQRASRGKSEERKTMSGSMSAFLTFEAGNAPTVVSPRNSVCEPELDSARKKKKIATGPTNFGKFNPLNSSGELKKSDIKKGAAAKQRARASDEK